MSTIVCRGLSFGFDGSVRNVFTNLGLVIDTGWRSDLVGRDGHGKTILLRLIHDELTSDRGTVEHAVVTRRFPCIPSNPAISAFDAAKDATGPCRRWEVEMNRLLDAGDVAALARYGTLQARFQDAGGYGIDADISRELAAERPGARGAGELVGKFGGLTPRRVSRLPRRPRLRRPTPRPPGLDRPAPRARRARRSSSWS
ncbi:MAG: hypothetical protein OXC08_00895 [Thiotrichales bacterium]|nr:hypothetical protein [Thiotrichales bacterium]